MGLFDKVKDIIQTKKPLTKYSGKTDIVHEYLVEILNKNEQNFDSYNSNYNSYSSGDKNITVMKSKNTKFTSNNSSNQIVIAAFTATMSDMFNDAMTVSNDAKVNLDVLANLSNALESSKVLKSASGEVSINEITNISSKSKDIQSIINAANYCSTQKCENEVMLGNVNVSVISSTNTWIELNENIDQSIMSNTETIASLAKEANILSEREIENIVKKTLSAEQTVDEKGVGETLSNGFMSGLIVPIVIGVVVIIVIFLMFVFILIFALKKR